MSKSAGTIAIAVGALGALFVTWVLLHQGFWAERPISDVPVYERYGEAMVAGEVPYRDFAVEYPPGALPVFALPTVGDGSNGYRRLFEALMWLCGAAALVAMVVSLSALGRRGAARAAPPAFAAVLPLALGSVVLSRFDLLPAALAVAALAALVGGRERVGCAVLGLGAVVKVFPGVLVPLALAFVWRREGRREALICGAILAGAIAACVLPFAAISPGGLWDAFSMHATRGLQIESLGSAILLAAHQVGDIEMTTGTSAGSQNLVGTGADVLAAGQTVLQLAALAAIWTAFARRGDPGDRERLVRYAAAAVCAFVALGKVLSPQFLIWLLPLVPLVGGRRGAAASALLALAAVLTQLWFPHRYWDLVEDLDATATWLVLTRDVLLLAIVAVLVSPARAWSRRRARLQAAAGSA
ncbi:MAG: DUF2029 domain-containing protein [Thermoleophilia bacterium]|nr:DUF2029 domain-containing protein [Thermoleophilia bacterium]